MTPRVREILSWYSAETPAVLVRLAQVLNHGRTGGTGKLILADVSQGVEDGPLEAFALNPNAYEPLYHFRLACELKLSALVAPLGMIESCMRDFAGEIPVFLKIDHGVTLYSWQGEYASSTVENAHELGCHGVVFTLAIGSADFAKQVGRLANQIAKAKKTGLLAMVSLTRAIQPGEDVKRENLPLDQAAHAVQLACQMGAHLIDAPSLDVPVAGMREAYAEKHLPVENLEERTDHLMQAAFNGQRLVVARFPKHWPIERRAEDFRAWTSSGAFGLNLASSLYTHSAEVVEKELDRLENVLLGMK